MDYYFKFRGNDKKQKHFWLKKFKYKLTLFHYRENRFFIAATGRGCEKWEKWNLEKIQIRGNDSPPKKDSIENQKAFCWMKKGSLENQKAFQKLKKM